MAAGRRISVSFRDARGQVASSRYYLQGVDAASLAGADNAIQSALAACTLAHVYGTSINHSPEAVVYGGTTGGYDSVEDKLVLVFQTADGSTHRYSCPSPKFSDFEADGESAAVGDTNVSSLIGAIIANVTSRSGEAMSVSLGGYRHRSRTIRRFNVIVKNPTLTGEGL